MERNREWHVVARRVHQQINAGLHEEQIVFPTFFYLIMLGFIWHLFIKIAIKFKYGQLRRRRLRFTMQNNGDVDGLKSNIKIHF